MNRVTLKPLRPLALSVVITVLAGCSNDEVHEALEPTPLNRPAVSERPEPTWLEVNERADALEARVAQLEQRLRTEDSL